VVTTGPAIGEQVIHVHVAGPAGELVESVAKVRPRVEPVSRRAGAHAQQHRRRLQPAVAAHVQPVGATDGDRADGPLGGPVVDGEPRVAEVTDERRPLIPGIPDRLPRQRKWVRYEYPQGRRVNALATYEPFACPPARDAIPFERTLTAEGLVAYLRERLPAAEVPRVAVPDNAGMHTSKVVKAARPGLAKRGIYLYYLPPYSPPLNHIEPVFKPIKQHDMPTRSFASREELRMAVQAGFDTFGQRLTRKRDKPPRRPA
jgi:transposase